MTCKITIIGGATLTPDTYTLNPAATAETTEHPVEDGSAIADNIIVKPNKCGITTFWTPRPPQDGFLPDGLDRPAQAFDALCAALQYKRSLRVEIDGQTYFPAVLTEVSMPRTFDDGDGRTISINVTQIQIVAGKTVAVTVAQKLKGGGKAKKTVAVPQPTALGSAISIAANLAVGNWSQAVLAGVPLL